MRIIGVTGPTGAGKDTAADYLARRLKLTHISGGDIIRAMLQTAGLEVTKDAVRSFSIALRAQYGPEAVIERAVVLNEGHDNFVLSGFRTPVEAEAIRRRGVVVYIEAAAELRHGRIMRRERSGDIFDTSRLTDFDQKEQGMQHGDDEDLLAIKATADYVIDNNARLAELHQQLDELVAQLG